MPAKYQNKYRIESNRWQWWDYSAPGSYFITICIKNREKILGHVENKKMQLSDFGELVENEIRKIPEYHHRASLDAWVVMPKRNKTIPKTTQGNVDPENCWQISNANIETNQYFTEFPGCCKLAAQLS